MNSLQVNVYSIIITTYTNILLLSLFINNYYVYYCIYLFCSLCLLKKILVQFPYIIDLDICTHMFYLYFYYIYFV